MARPVSILLRAGLIGSIVAGLSGCDKEPEYVRNTQAPAPDAEPTGPQGVGNAPAEIDTAGIKRPPIDPAVLRPATEQELGGMRAAVEALGTAIVEDDGELALSVIDSQSIEFYGGAVMDMALRMGERRLLAQPFRVRLSVLLYRCAFNCQVARTLDDDARGAIARIFETSGALIFGPVTTVEFGEVFVQPIDDPEQRAASGAEAIAHAQMIHRGQPMTAGYRFILEEGEWKVDLDRLLYSASVDMEMRFATEAGDVNGGLTEFIRPGSTRLDTVFNFWGPILTPEGGCAPTTADADPTVRFGEGHDDQPAPPPPVDEGPVGPQLPPGDG